MTQPEIGTTYRYTGDAGLAATHADRELPAEMTELDLHPDTTVKVVGHDEERDLVLVEWTDRSSNPRITSVEPAVFAQHFRTEG